MGEIWTKLIVLFGGNSPIVSVGQPPILHGTNGQRKEVKLTNKRNARCAACIIFGKRKRKRVNSGADDKDNNTGSAEVAAEDQAQSKAGHKACISGDTGRFEGVYAELGGAMNEVWQAQSEEGKGPSDYVSRSDWGHKRSKTHKQKKCSICRLWHIWEKKKAGE